MSLSRRGQKWATSSDDLTIWKVLKDLWHPQDNPDGFVSLGVAENALMHDELTKYIHDNVSVPANGLTYGDGGSGSKQLRSAIAKFLNRKLRPVVPLTLEHICATNGVTTGIEHLSNITADPGDVFLLGQPHYGAFIDDIELRTGVIVVKVAFDNIDPVSLDAVEAYQRAIEACQARGKRVAGLMLCNPHNPLGRCYPRGTIVELMRLCGKHKIHLVSDEIYAFSVFKSAKQDPAAVDFVSLLSIPTENLIDPSLTHVLYGLSKDFGANGLRLGCLISQHNPALHKALIPVSIYSYVSSLTESVATKLLSDDRYIDWYIRENTRRLHSNFALATAWADKHGLEYTPGVNAAFFLWVQLGAPYRQAVQSGRVHSSHDTLRDIDAATTAALLENKIFLAAGTAFGSERPGWFRIVFSQQEQVLQEGLRRIEKTLGLGADYAQPRRNLKAKL